jgi:hypothetical protein
MLSLISINSDDIKGRRYLVFSDGLITITGSDDHSDDLKLSLKTDFPVVCS